MAIAQQRHRNGVQQYEKIVHVQANKEVKQILLHYPIVPVGKSRKRSSPWRDSYRTLK